MAQTEIVGRILSCLSQKPISFNKLCRSSKLHPKTVKRYLEIVQLVQRQEKVEIVTEGFRLFIKK